MCIYNNQLVVPVDPVEGKAGTPWGLDNPSNGLAWSPDGVHISASAYGGMLHSSNTRTGGARTLNVGGTPRRIAFDPLGRVALIGNESGT